MHLANTPQHEYLIRKLERIWPLKAEERQALLALPMLAKEYPSGSDVVQLGGTPKAAALMLKGIAFGYRMNPKGGRQIISYFVPGDLPDLQCLYLPVMDHSIGTIRPATVGFIPHEPLREVLATHTGVAEAFARVSLIDAAIYRERLVSLGRRQAPVRLAHLLCELCVRLNAVGQADERGFTLPFTQEELGDSLGLSTVHINRAMQCLRADGFIASRGRQFQIPDFAALARLGEFDPNYLHMEWRTSARGERLLAEIAPPKEAGESRARSGAASLVAVGRRD